MAAPQTTTATKPPTTVPVNVDDVASDLAFDMGDMKHCFDNLIVIDAGANLTNKKYSRDLDSVIQRAKDAGKFSKVVVGNLCKVMKKVFKSALGEHCSGVVCHNVVGGGTAEI